MCGDGKWTSLRKQQVWSVFGIQNNAFESSVDYELVSQHHFQVVLQSFVVSGPSHELPWVF